MIPAKKNNYSIFKELNYFLFLLYHNVITIIFNSAIFPIKSSTGTVFIYSITSSTDQPKGNNCVLSSGFGLSDASQMVVAWSL